MNHCKTNAQCLRQLLKLLIIKIALINKIYNTLSSALLKLNNPKAVQYRYTNLAGNLRNRIEI